jgi:hypothetical protein
MGDGWQDEEARWLALITAVLCLRREYDLAGDLVPVSVQSATDKASELLAYMRKKTRARARAVREEEHEEK